MITIFNRKLLICTYDMKICSRVREVLEYNNIEYYLNPVNSSWNTSRASKAEYKIYVKKEDFEQSEWLIRDIC